MNIGTLDPDLRRDGGPDGPWSVPTVLTDAHTAGRSTGLLRTDVDSHAWMIGFVTRREPCQAAITLRSR